MKRKPDSGRKGGRPVKFAEPSRPVTVTLPLRILDGLAGIDADRAKAIVKVVEAAIGKKDAPHPPVYELPIGQEESLLAIADNRFLRRIPWISLLELAPGRHLVSLKSGVSLEKLEVTLGDILDAPGDATPAELALLRQLRDRIRTPRRNQTVRPEAILIIHRTHAPHTGEVST